MIGSGGRSGHSCVCSWIDDELYVLESQDGWYWPKKGIQRNKWDDWIQWAHNADFNVALLPLREEYRQKMDFEKANAWFETDIEFSFLQLLQTNSPLSRFKNTLFV